MFTYQSHDLNVLISAPPVKRKVKWLAKQNATKVHCIIIQQNETVQRFSYFQVIQVTANKPLASCLCPAGGQNTSKRRRVNLTQGKRAVTENAGLCTEIQRGHITQQEMKEAIRQTKGNRAPGEDTITLDML